MVFCFIRSYSKLIFSSVQVWAIDLDLTYSNQLAMTQMLLMMTGGTLNFCTGCLEVPMPVSEACCGHRTASEVPFHMYLK